MSSFVNPSVEITSISITFCSSKYWSTVIFISGLAAFIPAKKPTPSKTTSSIDINLLKVFLISFIVSFSKAFFNFNKPLLYQSITTLFLQLVLDAHF